MERSFTICRPHNNDVIVDDHELAVDVYELCHRVVPELAVPPQPIEVDVLKRIAHLGVLAQNLEHGRATARDGELLLVQLALQHCSPRLPDIALESRQQRGHNHHLEVLLLVGRLNNSVDDRVRNLVLNHRARGGRNEKLVLDLNAVVGVVYHREVGQLDRHFVVVGAHSERPGGGRTQHLTFAAAGAPLGGFQPLGGVLLEDGWLLFLLYALVLLVALGVGGEHALVAAENLRHVAVHRATEHLVVGLHEVLALVLDLALVALQLLEQLDVVALALVERAQIPHLLGAGLARN